MAATIHDALIAMNVIGYQIDGYDIHSEDEFINHFRRVTHYDSDGVEQFTSDPDRFGVTWDQIQNKKNELDNARPMLVLRMRRDKFLKQTDWVVTKAMEEGKSVPTKWKTYRQALRDLPATAEPKLEDGVLTNVTWPTKPS